jgi:hypothetical protein
MRTEAIGICLWQYLPEICHHESLNMQRTKQGSRAFFSSRLSSSSSYWLILQHTIAFRIMKQGTVIKAVEETNGNSKGISA